jgi:hypothetical protein
VAGPPLPDGEIPLTGSDGSSFSYSEETLHAKALVSWTPVDVPAPGGGVPSTPTAVHAAGDHVTVNLPGSTLNGLTGEVQTVNHDMYGPGQHAYHVKVPGHSAMWLDSSEVSGADGSTDPAPPKRAPGELKPSSLKDKPGALFTHKGVTMSVAADQSVADSDELIAIAPDGHGWLITPNAGGVTPIPGTGATKVLSNDDKAVYQGQQVTVVNSQGPLGGDGETPGGHVQVDFPDGTTGTVPGSMLQNVPSAANLKQGDLVHVHRPLDPANPSLGEQNVIGNVAQVLPNGKVQLEGTSMLFSPEHVTSLAAHPFKPGDDVQHADGTVGDFAHWHVGADGKPKMTVYVQGTDTAWDPEQASLASVDVPDPVGIVMAPKATQQLPYDVLQPGDPAKFSNLQTGDHYLPVGPAGNTGDPWVVVSAPESAQHNGKVQKVGPNGEPTGMVYDLYPDAPVLLHAKAADVAAKPAPLEAAVDLDSLPDASDHGFVGYKSHKGSGGKWSHHMIKTMPEGTVFADLNGKQWKVKQAGAQPVITDGDALFTVSGQLRGKDLNQPAVKQNANLVDNSPPVGWHAPEPVMVPTTDTFQELGLAAGDEFKVNSSPDVWTVDAVDDDGFVNASTAQGVSGPATTLLGPAAKPTHVSAAAMAKPTPPVPAPEAEPAPDASPTLYTAPVAAGALAVGDQFTLAPGSGNVYTVTFKTGAGIAYEGGELDAGFDAAASLDAPVYVEPSAPAPVGPWSNAATIGAMAVGDLQTIDGVQVYKSSHGYQVTGGASGTSFYPDAQSAADAVAIKSGAGAAPVGQPVDPASVTTINDVDEFADVPPVPADPAPTPQPEWPKWAGPGKWMTPEGKQYSSSSLAKEAIGKAGATPAPASAVQPDGPLQAFGSRLGPGGIYKHDKLSELQVGQLFTDKSGTDYQLVSHGEGSAFYKNVATGAVMEAKNDLRVKRTALPPQPDLMVVSALDAVQAKYGGLDSVPTTTVTGYTTATGEGGKIKYPRSGHLKAGEHVKAADGTTFTHIASWLDKSLAYMGDGEWRIIPAATRVKRIA